MSREVLERDIRMPEFRDAKLGDLEFRGDGKIVRKDRWETAIHSIRGLVGSDGRDFEISEVVDAVRALADKVGDIENAVGNAIWNELKGLHHHGK